MEETLTSGSSLPQLRGPSSQLKKRKRLNAVLDKISHRSSQSGSRMLRGSEQDVPASQRRELWRDNPQRNALLLDECSEAGSKLSLSIPTAKKLVIDSSGGSESLEDSDVASPLKSSPLSSPQVGHDSPRICFSPLRIKDSIEEEETSTTNAFNVPKFSIRESLEKPPGRAKARSRSSSTRGSSKNPLPPRQAPPLSHLPSYLTEIYRRRCLSDTDLSATLEDLIKAQAKKLADSPPSHFLTPLKAGSRSLESADSQDSPLDLSVKSNVSSTTGTKDTSSSTTSLDSLPKGGGGLLAGKLLRSSLEIVESGNPEVSYSCPICGQMFSLHDRLAKHMASRHKSPSRSAAEGGPNAKAYACEVCKRSFARSDMLTRHMRLHTGIKPYTCRICGQVFSRSDHLSTHQRTHTGEKPYRCPSCPYAACRRDMITRHMRTHTRYELSESTSVEDNTSSRSISCESDWNPDSKDDQQTNVPPAPPSVKPPSPMDTSDKTSPTTTTTNAHDKR